MPLTDLSVLAPVAGRVTTLDEVPDPVFGAGMVGPGLAIAPVLGTAVVEALAPVGGVVAAIHPHAFVIAGPGAGERGVLVHLGIDTVQLKGRGFELLAELGEEVAARQPVVRWSPDDVVARGMSALVPVIALAADPAMLDLGSGDVEAGDHLFDWHAQP